MKKINVLLIGTKSEFSNPAGFSRYSCELYNSLIKISKRATIIKSDYNEFPPFYKGLTPLIHSLLENYGRYDIIHNIEPKPFLPIKRANATLITTFHDFRPLLRQDLTKSDFRSIRTALGLFFVSKLGINIGLHSDYIIANSTQTKNEAISLGYDKKRVFVTGLGVDERFLSYPKIKNRRKEKTFTVGYLGLVGESKNVQFAINSFKLLKFRNIKFDIWGKKEYNYRKLTDLAKSNKNINFMGFAPENKIVQIYDSFDVFVHPSFYEGFGLPILEALARGLPVIIYKYGKIPKEVRKYCFEAESPEHMAQIIEYLKENGYNEKFRKKATAYARSFTWDRCARETLKVYEKVVKNG